MSERDEPERAEPVFIRNEDAELSNGLMGNLILCSARGSDESPQTHSYTDHSSAPSLERGVEGLLV